jgi:integrase
MAAERHRIPVGDDVKIFRRGKNGIYQADFQLKGHRVLSLRTSNKKVAMSRALELAIKLDQNRYSIESRTQQPSPAPMSLDDARQHFLAVKEADGRQRKTLVKYGGILRGFIEFARGQGVERVDQSTLVLFDRFRQMRRAAVVRGRPLSDKQMHIEGVVIKQFFAWCCARNLIEANPLAHLRLPRPTQQRKGRSLSLVQVNQLLAIAPPRAYGPLAVLAFTGMRSSSCCQLRVEDVDFDAGWIHVRSRAGARTKTGTDCKTPLHPRLRAILLSLPRHQSGFYFRAEASPKYPRGDHWLNAKRLNEDFLKLLKAVRISAGRYDGFTLHDLRRFFKSHCIAHGVPREYVDNWQGHATIRSASDLYVETFDDQSQRHMQQVPFGDGLPAGDAGSSS